MQQFHLKRRFIASALLIAIMLIAIIFLTPSSVPVAHATGPSLFTSLTLQNLDPSLPMNAKLTYFNPNGQSVLSTLNTIPPYHSLTLNQPSQLGLPTNFAGTATLDSDTPFGSVVTEYNGTASALGKNFDVDSYSFIPATDAATTFVFPQLLKNIYDAGTALTYNSTIAIQNPSPTAGATFTITFTQSTGQVYVHSGLTIPAGGSYTVDLASDAALSGVSAFYGLGRVTSTQPIAVVGHQNAAGLTMSYAGLSSTHAATTLYIPQLLKGVYDSTSGYTWNTSVVAMAMDGSPVNVTLTYRDTNGIVYTDSVGPTSMPSFDQRYSSALSNLPSFFGSGVLTANKPIVALVYVSTNPSGSGTRSAAFRAFPSLSAGSRVSLPMIEKNALDTATGVSWSTSIVGRLVGDSPTTVTFAFYLADGTIHQETASLSPTSPMFGLDQRYDTGLPDGTVAAGILSTNPPQPIIVTVHVMAGSSVSGDAQMTYEGIAQ